MDLLDSFIRSDSAPIDAARVLIPLLIFYLLLRWGLLRAMRGRKVLAEICAIALLLLMLEGVASSLEKLYPPVFVPHVSRMWALNPGYIGRPGSGPFGNTPLTINSLGLRNSEISPSKDQRELRILLFGDSCPFGQHVRIADAFSSVLEQELASKLPGRKVTVINAAVPGYSTSQGLLLAREIAPVCKPDLVIVAFNNDSMLDRAEDKARAADGHRRMSAALSGSKLFLVATRVLSKLAKRSSSAELPQADQRLVQRVSKDDSTQNLLALASLAKKYGAKALFVGLPVTPSLVRHPFENPAGSAEYRDIMKEAASSTGASFADLNPGWREGGMEKHMLDFCHPDAAGHKAIGKRLAAWILKERLLP